MLNLKLARIKSGMTQGQLAEKIGVTNIDICRYESGKVTPPVDKLCKLADALNTSIDHIVGRDKNER